MGELQNAGKKVESSLHLVTERAKGMLLGVAAMKLSAWLKKGLEHIADSSLGSIKIAASSESVLQTYKKLTIPACLPIYTKPRKEPSVTSNS